MAATLRKYISVKAPSTGQDDLGKAIRTEVFSKNRLGGAVSYLGVAVQDFKEIAKVHTEFELDALQREKEIDEKEHKHKVSIIEAQEDILGRKKGREKDKASEKLQEKQKAPAQKKKDGEKLAKKQKGKFGFLKNLLQPLNSLGMMLMKVLAPLLTMKLLEWIGKEENREALKKIFGFVSAIWTFSRALAGLGIDLVMKGITNIFGDSEKTGVARIFEQMFGVLQLVGGLAALWAASRVLMPWKLIGDVKFMRGLGKAVSDADQQRMRPDRDGRRLDGPDVDVDGKKRRAGSRERYERRFGKDAANRKFGKPKRPRGRKRRMLGGLMGMCPNPLDLLPDNTPKNVVDNVAKNVDNVGDAAKATKVVDTAVDLGETATDVATKAPKKLNWWQKLQKAGSNTVEGLKTGAKAGVDFIGDKAIKFGNWANKGMKSAWEATTATAQKFGTGIKNFAVETVDGLGTKAKKFFMEQIVAKVQPFVEPIIEQANKVGTKLMEGLQKIPGYDKVGKLFSEKGITNVATAGGKLGKRAAAVLPVIGGVVNLAFAYDRFAAGDSVGGLLESISGVLDIAGLATAGATNVASMFLDGYLFARDFIPALADGENALINTLGLGGLKSQLDSQLSKLPGLGELVGKLMSMLGFGEKEGEGAQELARGGKVKEGMQKKKDIPNPVYTTPTPFIKGFDIPTEGEGQFRRFAGGGLYVFSTAPAGAPKLMGHGKGFGDTYPHHHPKPGGNVPRAGGIPRDYLISELKNPSTPDSKGDRHPIRAGVSGTVDSVGEGWGAVRIKDANGPIFRSGHMTGIKVKMGQQVNPSTIIGIQDAVGMSNGYVHAHIEGKTAAIHNAWIKANSGSKSTGSDDIDVPTGDDGSSTPKMSSPNSAGDKLNADGTPQEKTPQKPKKINIMEVFNNLGGAELLKGYFNDMDPNMGGGSSGSTVSGGGGTSAAQLKQEEDAINNKSQMLKKQSVAAEQRVKELQGGNNQIMIMRQQVFGANTPAPEIITPGSGITPLLTGK
tara:strand:+ start:3262 stop:6294 length:3033 start_codon:yes stop_codon:yes gene_type:complete